MIDKTLEDILSTTKKELKSLSSNVSFWEEFINTIKLLDSNQNQINLAVKNSYAKQILTNDFLQTFQQSFSSQLKRAVLVSFVVGGETPQSQTNTNKFTKPRSSDSNLNQNYTFKNFIVKNFNKNAYNAAKSIFQQHYWNPIFISGGVGLGKTHLLHAVGNEYLLTRPAASVKYIPAGEFIREVYNSLSQGSSSVETLKDQYTNYDLLLIDDTQFLAKKEKMNEIFFHIFNKNISQGKLIVMTSDKPPGSLEGFEERIKSRFGSGLSIVITPPDTNSMCAILQEKIKESGGEIILTHDAMDYVVRRNNKDIRRLEGYLHKVLFYAINNLPPNCIITTEIIQNNIDKLDSEQGELHGYDFDPNMVIEKICLVYNVDISLVKSKMRTKQISLVRDVCMFALRDKFKMSLESVGVLFGRHHTTVMDSIEKINKLLKRDDNLKHFIIQLYKNM